MTEPISYWLSSYNGKRVKLEANYAKIFVMELVLNMLWTLYSRVCLFDFNMLVSRDCIVGTDFVLQPPKSGHKTVRLEPVRTHCFSGQAHGTTLGHIFFGFWSPKFDNQWKVLRECLKNLPMGGPLGNQVFPQGCAPQESLITLGTSLGQIFKDNPFGLFTICTTPWYWAPLFITRTRLNLLLKVIPINVWLFCAFYGLFGNFLTILAIVWRF